MDFFDGSYAAAFVGLLTGLVLGLAARRARFCTLGAIEDALYADNWMRMRMWAVALGSAIVGVHVAVSAGFIDLGATLYAGRAWNPVSSIVGGLTFGYGMAIAGNCGYGALARLGGGDLRALVIVIVTGIAAYMTIAGPFAVMRLMLFPPVAADEMTPTSFLDLGAMIGVPAVAVVLAASLPMLGWALRDAAFRKDLSLVLWSVGIGAAIVAGWIGTSQIAEASFEPVRVQSHTFTRPLGESLLFLMTSSATPLTFTLGSVGGVLVGAFFGSVSRGSFRWEACDDPRELGRQILGGMLMGIGGVLALGCSVGQGLTAFSTLALSAPVVLLSIGAGAALGLRQLIQGFQASN